MKKLVIIFIIIFIFISNNIFANECKKNEDIILTKISSKLCNPITIDSSEFENRPIVFTLIANDTPEKYNLFQLNLNVVNQLPHLKISHSRTPRHSDIDIVGRIKDVHKKSYNIKEIDDTEQLINFDLQCKSGIKASKITESPHHILINNDINDKRNEYNVYTVVIDFIINNKQTKEIFRSQAAITIGKVNLSYELAQEKINNKLSDIAASFIK